MQNNKKKIIILTGPSGAGKSTLVKGLLGLFGAKVMACTVSYTTRPLRGKEQASLDYHFVSEKKFLDLQKQGFFAEWAKVYGHYYGTSNKEIQKHWQAGRAIIKDLDLQGAKAIKKLYPQALRVFVAPPSLKELAHRIQKRQENTDKEIKSRIQEAQEEIQQSTHFEQRVENKDFEKTLQNLKKIIEIYLKAG